MQRSEVGERLQPPHDVVVDDDGLDELGPAVHDAVPDRVDPLERVEVDVVRHELVPVEHRELEAARSRVDDENSQCDQTQSRTAG